MIIQQLVQLFRAMRVAIRMIRRAGTCHRIVKTLIVKTAEGDVTYKRDFFAYVVVRERGERVV